MRWNVKATPVTGTADYAVILPPTQPRLQGKPSEALGCFFAPLPNDEHGVVCARHAVGSIFSSRVDADGFESRICPDITG